ncbi:MAG: type II secretion system protein [Leptolyngbyaceae cyanobacterium RM1_406_9]|nr:type II secretion system protein [Leptolyngbyaceae cyanobacterium RM1_406_9]
MAASFLKQKLGRLLQPRHKRKNSGFTLIELLVVILISGGIISGLMYLVVELLTIDQREASRTETQREMQLAMDYIASELREAVYVYDGRCFAGNDPGNSNNPESCYRLIDHLPANLQNANNIPVLAFWKQQPVPEPVKVRCSANANNAIANGDPCTSASSYALVVYYISLEDPNNIWAGRARIKRYALTEFQNDGTSNNVFAGGPRTYVKPDEASVKFASWPYGTDPVTSLFRNLQTNRPTDTSAILVDFLDSNLASTAMLVLYQTALTDIISLLPTPRLRRLTLQKSGVSMPV